VPGGVDAGDFGAWLGDITIAIAGEGESSVPCGECSACCSSSQFIHIEPAEAGALARIPPELLFPAPGLPPGHVVMGYDELGRCPMLVEARCSIYEDRPRACRAYDCRVFAATGVVPDEAGKEAVAARVAEWRFSVSRPADQARLDALRAAGDLVSGQVSTAGLPSTARALAALAVVRD
jgi:Fe-S-cluster containining protein